MRDGGAIRGSKDNTGVMGGDAAAIREQARRVKTQEVAEERAGLLEGEGRGAGTSEGRPGWGDERAPTPGRSAGLEANYDTHPSTATYLLQTAYSLCHKIHQFTAVLGIFYGLRFPWSRYGREEVNVTKCQIIAGVVGVVAVLVVVRLLWMDFWS